MTDDDEPSENLMRLRAAYAADGAGKNVADSVRQARADHLARAQAVKDGTADPQVYKALEHVYAVADRAKPARRADLREYGTTLVLDAIGAATRGGKPIDPDVIGRKAAKDLAQTLDYIGKGGIGGALGLLRSDDPTISRIRSDITSSRIHPDVVAKRIGSDPVVSRLQVPPPEPSPLAELRRDSEERGERQARALEGLLNLAERDSDRSRLALIIATVACVAAVVAAIAAVVAVILA